MRVLGRLKRWPAAVALIALAVIALLAPAPAFATTVVIKDAIDDAHIDQQNPNQNQGSVTTMTVKSQFQGQSDRNHRSLVKFPLDGIPAGSTIVSATLELHMATAPGASRTYEVNRVTTSFAESGVTWNNATTSTLWSAAGGDFTSALKDAVTPTPGAVSGTSNGVWLTWDVSETVRRWFEGTESNFGFLVKDATESSTTTYTATFATRENTGQDFNFNPARALKPRLSITYQPPDLQVTTMSVDPSTFGGDTVTISMTVTNNGSVTLNGVTPTALTFSGTATPCSTPTGPTPTSANLAPATSQTFTWTCSINGAQGDTYAFTGGATSTSPSVTAPSLTTNTGKISIYTVSVTPTEVQSIGTNVQVTFRITNGLTSGTIDWLNIVNPNTSIWQFTDPGWEANDASGWNHSVQQGVNYRFISPNSSADIPANQGFKDFTITFSQVNDPGIDTVYDFDVTVRQRGKQQDVLVQQPITVRIPALEISSLTVDSTVASGGNVRIVMTVKNRGSGTLTNVTPSSTLTPSGTATTKTYVSGPTPPSVSSLSGGASTSFEWTYQITGTVGQTYAFAGSVQANGGNVTAGPTTSNSGTIASYDVSVDPTTVTAGATNVQLKFTVTNALSSGTVDRIKIVNPNSTFWVTDASWAANNSTTNSSNWTTSEPAAGTYQFLAPAAGTNDIPANSGTRDFIVTFANVGDPGLDTTYTFNVVIHKRGDNSNAESTVTAQVTVTRYVLELISVTPSTVPADGVTTSVIKVRLHKSGVGQVGESLTFSTTGGTFPTSVTTTTASTQSGTPPNDAIATVTLTPPISKSSSTATITVSFASVASLSTSVSFTGITIADASYFTGTAGNGTVTTYWQTPSPGYSEHVIMLRREGAAPTETLADDAVYTDGQTLGSSTVIKLANSPGANGSTTFPALTNGTKYFYKIFNAYKDKLYSSAPLTLDVIPTDGANGKPTWTYNVAGAGASLGIPLSDGANVFAARGQRVFSLVPATGAQNWITGAFGGNVEGWVLPWYRTSDGLPTLYFGTTDGKVYNYGTDGTRLWETAQLGDSIQASVGVQSGAWWGSDEPFRTTFGTMDMIIAATRNSSTTNNKVYALRAFTGGGGTAGTGDGGSTLWTFTPGTMDMIVSLPQPTFSNELFIASHDGDAGQATLWKLDLLTGGLMGSKTGLGDISADMWIGLDQFNGATPTIYVGTQTNGLAAIDSATLATKWTYSTNGSAVVGFIWEDFSFYAADPDPAAGPRPGAPRRLYFATQDGKIHAINDDGTSASQAWAPVTVTSPSTPLVDDLFARKLWVGAGSGRLYEIDIDTGASKFAVTGEAGETMGDPAFDPTNFSQIFVGSSAGRLHAVPVPLP